MVLESTSKDLHAIQEKLRDTGKAIEETKEVVCFFSEHDIMIILFLPSFLPSFLPLLV
jgi:hypothetical protein